MTTSDTPETDKWTGLRHDIRELAETSRRLERERNEKTLLAMQFAGELHELRSAIRNLRDMQGRHNTEIACKRLFELLPESQETP